MSKSSSHHVLSIHVTLPCYTVLLLVDMGPPPCPMTISPEIGPPQAGAAGPRGIHHSLSSRETQAMPPAKALASRRSRTHSPLESGWGQQTLAPCGDSLPQECHNCYPAWGWAQVTVEH